MGKVTTFKQEKFSIWFFLSCIFSPTKQSSIIPIVQILLSNVIIFGCGVVLNSFLDFFERPDEQIHHFKGGQGWGVATKVSKMGT